MTNAILKDFARNMIDKGATDQFIDAAILSRYQKSHGLTECKNALATARLESAAPDLLKALEECLGWHDDSSNEFKPIEIRAALLRELKESVGALHPYPNDPNLEACLIRVERYLKGVPNAPRPI